MWLLEFLPSWVVYCTLLAGIIGTVIGFTVKDIPGALACRAASILLTVIGIFLTGSIFNNDKWKARVAEAELRVAAAEVKSAQENVKIVTNTVEKIKYIQDVQVVVQKEIQRDTAVIDAGCKIPPEFIAIHNKSATRGVNN